MQPQDNSNNKYIKPDSNIKGSTASSNSAPLKPIANIGENPNNTPVNQNITMDYSDPSSPPPPIVVEVEQKFANIPKDDRQPTVNKSSPINNNVNWSDSTSKTDNHYDKRLFMALASGVILIIVGLGAFMTINTNKTPEALLSTSKKGATSTLKKPSSNTVSSNTNNSDNKAASKNGSKSTSSNSTSSTSSTEGPIDKTIPADDDNSDQTTNTDTTINAVDTSDTPDIEDSTI